MKTYVVGGCVRDVFMAVEPKDIDYVVVGSNVQEMLDNGFEQVGADFPVFLKNGDEYALARTEKKNGTGYNGFETSVENVSLEEDLSRRDLTMNAIAYDDATQQYIDPFNGADDIANKVLKHTTDAFMDDPVRVLRVARFMARFGDDWTVHPDTVKLISHMGKKGRLEELSKERVFKEFSRAMMENHPRLFFDTLYNCNVLHILFPRVFKLMASIENPIWHPEKNSYEHTMLVLTQAAQQHMDFESRYACLVHDFGKTLTPVDKMPSHYGHDVNGVRLVEEFSEDYGVPTKATKLAKFATRYHMYMHKLTSLNGKTIVKMFDSVQAEKTQNEDYIDVLYRVGVCDERGRLGSENNKFKHVAFIWELLDEYQSFKFVDFWNGEKDKKSVERAKNDLFKARANALNELKKWKKL